MPILAPDPDNDPIFDALRVAQDRDPLATTRSTAELRELAAGIRARSVFVARGANANFLSKLKEVIDQVAGGEMGRSEARVTLLETLRALGYTPEGGFPDAEGVVPPAVAGSIEDLSSFRRIDLIVRTQTDLMAGAGQQLRGHDAQRLALFPAWELVRYEQADFPRDWPERWEQIGGDLKSGGRTISSTGTLKNSGRMIALKGDPIWGELGASGNFDDALDVDHPPFAFNSGMGWMEVDRATAERLGVTGPNGESIDDFHSGMERPVTLRGALPKPRLSVRSIDPALSEALKDETRAEEREPGTVDFSDILEEEVAAAQEAYERRNGS
ncbi:MAG: hypothetical protein AAGI48_03815 [Verrucomicrobiota bacterium]